MLWSYDIFLWHTSSYILSSRILKKEASDINLFNSSWTVAPRLTLVSKQKEHVVAHHSLAYWLNPNHILFLNFIYYQINSKMGALIELKNVLHFWDYDMSFTYPFPRVSVIYMSAMKLSLWDNLVELRYAVVFEVVDMVALLPKLWFNIANCRIANLSYFFACFVNSDWAGLASAS